MNYFKLQEQFEHSKQHHKLSIYNILILFLFSPLNIDMHPISPTIVIILSQIQ